MGPVALAAAPRVLIAGGGIGGLTAALALIRRGIGVQVFEQAPALREVGAGVQISANGSRALAGLGLLPAVAAASCEASGKEIRLWNTGQTWPLFDLGADSVRQYGFPYLTVFRPDLLDALAGAVEQAQPGAIRLGAKVAGFTQSEAAVTLHFEDGTASSGEVLIGADGIHSRIRETLFGRQEAEFSGLVAWRGVVPMGVLPPHLARPVGTNWVGPGRHVVHYPLRRGEMMNFVGIVERSDWQVESWTTRGTTAELAADFAGWHPDVHAMIQAIEAPHKWALMLRRPLPRWTEGRVTLLGDACHPTLPMLAQGAVQAIEDGFILGRALAEHPDAREALRRYEAARQERTARMVLGSADNAKRFHNPALAEPEGAADYVAREWSEDRVRARYDWLFRYQVDTVPI